MVDVRETAVARFILELPGWAGIRMMPADDELIRVLSVHNNLPAAYNRSHINDFWTTGPMSRVAIKELQRRRDG